MLNDDQAPLNAGCITRIKRAIDPVGQRLREPLQLLALARTVHLSPVHLRRASRALAGQTRNQFIALDVCLPIVWARG